MSIGLLGTLSQSLGIFKILLFFYILVSMFNNCWVYCPLVCWVLCQNLLGHLKYYLNLHLGVHVWWLLGTLSIGLLGTLSKFIGVSLKYYLLYFGVHGEWLLGTLSIYLLGTISESVVYLKTIPYFNILVSMFGDGWVHCPFICWVHCPNFLGYL